MCGEGCAGSMVVGLAAEWSHAPHELKKGLWGSHVPSAAGVDAGNASSSKCNLCGRLLLPCVTQLLGEHSPGTEKQRHLPAAVLCCLLTKGEIPNLFFLCKK